MQEKTNPANFFLNSVFFFSLFLIPFTIIRYYFYLNYYYAANEFNLIEFLSMGLVGLRFDVCVLGFFLIPIYILYLVSYIEKIRKFIFGIAYVYKSLIILLTFLIFHLNIPFMAKNAPFDLPYWMHWPDYRSLVFLDCKVCYWDYGYQNSIYPIQIVSGLIFLLILFSLFSRWRYFSDSFNWKREVLFFVLLSLMARGKVGEHHLRYEDSLWHKAPLLNSLSNNPLWLIDKIRN